MSFVIEVCNFTRFYLHFANKDKNLKITRKSRNKFNGKRFTTMSNEIFFSLEKEPLEVLYKVWAEDKFNNNRFVRI